MWSTGEGNGKPLQYSCLENPNEQYEQYNPVYETAKETLMYRTVFWTLWERGSGWGACVHLWRILVDVWQNQYNIVK